MNFIKQRVSPNVLLYSAIFMVTQITGVLLSLWSVEKRHYHFPIGVLAGMVLSWIPIVNFLACLFVSALGWGVYLSFLFNKNLTVAEKN